MKKQISMFLVFVIIVSLLTPVISAAERIKTIPENDWNEHWAADLLGKWLDAGLIQGYTDGSLKPDASMTRAEFTVLINKVFGYNELKPSTSASFKDVNSSEWYADPIAKGVSAGYISGYPNQTFGPDAAISRQDAAVMMNRVFSLESETLGQLSPISFKDADKISSYAKSAVNILALVGYMQGYSSDNTFRPLQPITRAEIIVLLNRVIGDYIFQSGSVEKQAVQGNMVISHSGVTLRNTTIEGNLYLTPGIGEGEVTLDHVTVKGTTYVEGGGTSSIHVADSTLGIVKVDDPDHRVRLVVTGAAEVEKVVFVSGGILEENNVTGTGADQIEIWAKNGAEIVLSGEFSSVVVKGSGAKLTISSGSITNLLIHSQTMVTVDSKITIGTLVINTQGAGTEIKGTGTIGTIQINSDNVRVNGNLFGKGSVVEMSAGKARLKAPGGGGVNSYASNPGNSTSPATQSDWTMVWNDEFNGSTIDASKWGYDLGAGFGNGDGTVNDGWGNNEKEYYTNRPENAKVENGKLVITARKESYEGKDYTSARLKTMGKFSQAYGKFEIRAKLPTGKGYWPAIWMLPENNTYGGWASTGEIDIMEAKGSNPYGVSGTIHYGESWPNNKYTGKDYKFTNSAIDQFHTYALEWEPGEIRWYVDGNLYQTQNNWFSKGQGNPANFSYPAPFDQPFYLLLNLAVGGNFDGDPNNATIFPQTMEVDYIRVYELTGRAYRTPVEPNVQNEPLPVDARQPLTDGNLIYNSNYDQDAEGVDGIEGTANTDYWMFLHVPDFGGDGNVAIEKLGENNFAKINVTSPGNQDYAVQLIQLTTVGKGRWYKASFDAKSTTTRTLSSKISGGETRGWAVYSDNKTFELSNSVQHYEMVFQMSQNSDTAARFEINVGRNANPVWIGNVRLEEAAAPQVDEDAAKKPLSNGNHIYNGTFDQGKMDRMTYWHFNSKGTSQTAAGVNPSSRQLRVQITNGGTDPGDISLVQRGIQTLNDHDYRITFKASADAPRSIELELLSKTGLSYGKKTIHVTTGIQEYSVDFKLTGVTDAEGQIAFNLGGSNADVVLDDIGMVSLSNTIDPNVVLFPLKNGDFSDGLNSWNPLFIEGGQGSSSVDQGATKLSITNMSALPHGVMLIQSGMKFSNHVEYIVEFDAKSTIPRKMDVALENSSYVRSFHKQVELNTDMKRYKFSFVMDKDETLDLKFLLGKVVDQDSLAAHDVVIDNVAVEVKDAKFLTSIVKNGTFDGGSDGWQGYVEGAASAGTVIFDQGTAKAVIDRVGNENWHIQVATADNFTLVNGKSYKLTFDSSSTMNRDIQVIVEHGGGEYTKYAVQTLPVTATSATYSFTFTMNSATDSGTHLVFALGKVGQGVDSKHEVIIDNVSLMEVDTPATQVTPPQEGHELLNGTFDSNF